MMEKHRTFENIDSYIKALNDAAVTKVACAVINEKRSVQVAENSLEVLPVKRGDFIAYRDAVLLKYAAGEAFEDDAVVLEAAGFEIVHRNRNIT